jgi:hypothetical protein
VGKGITKIGQHLTAALCRHNPLTPMAQLQWVLTKIPKTKYKEGTKVSNSIVLTPAILNQGFWIVAKIKANWSTKDSKYILYYL